VPRKKPFESAPTARTIEIRLPGVRYRGDPAPIMGPQSYEEWFRATMDGIQKKDATPAAREEYRKLMDLHPDVAVGNGDLATLFRRGASHRYASQPVIQESLKFQTKAMRAQLAGPESSPIELLLIDAVLACYHDYWTFATICEQSTGQSFNLRDMEQWERVLASKEARYLRAVETLARVRRLLKLPTMQVNIAAAGGQQVNVAGDVKP